MMPRPALVNVPVIETERLILRGPETADFGPYAGFMASDRAAYVGGPLSRGMAWRGFCNLTGHWVHRGYGAFIVTDKLTGRPLGTSGPWFPEDWPEPELGWILWTAEAEGKGIAFEAAVACREHAYRALGWTTAISLIVKGNDRSQTLARRMGCVREGSFTHEIFGQSEIWRHPGAEARA